MTNRAAVVVVAFVVGVALYGGLVFVEERVATSDGPAPRGEVVVANATMHLDRVGRPTVVGRVVNGRGSAVTDAVVTVEFYRDDRRIGSASGATLVPTIDGSGSAPFAVRLENRSARPDAFELSLDYERATDRSYAGLTVVDSRIADRSQTQVILRGTVENAGDRSVEAHVVATFYDERGAVVGVRAVRATPDVLAPGSGGEFTVRFRTLGNVPSRAAQVDRFELAVWGEPVG